MQWALGIFHEVTSVFYKVTLTKIDHVKFGGVKYSNFPCFNEICPTNRAKKPNIYIRAIYLFKKKKKEQ